jgi:hypothetical protein
LSPWKQNAADSSMKEPLFDRINKGIITI